MNLRLLPHFLHRPRVGGFDRTSALSPGAASWLPEGGTALLTYEEVRNSASLKETLLEFMESAYQARAKRAG